MLSGARLLAKSLSSEAYRHAVSVLTATRTQANVTQAELARRLNRPQSYVSKFERAERRLDLIEYAEVARALGQDPVALIRRALAE